MWPKVENDVSHKEPDALIHFCICWTDIAVRIINSVKTRPFISLCEEVGADHQILLLPMEV